MTRLTGAPCAVSRVEPPACSPRVTLTGAPPVFLTVTIWLAVPCHGTVFAMLVGVIFTRPAARLNDACVVKFAATVTDFVFDT